MNNSHICARVDPPNANNQQVETAKKEAKEAYMEVSFHSGLNHNRYCKLMNDLHNTFRMGRYDYPKTLTNVYDLAIKWKGDTVSVAIPPNYGMAFVSDNRRQSNDVHAVDGSLALTRSEKPVECHICGMNKYANKCTGK